MRKIEYKPVVGAQYWDYTVVSENTRVNNDKRTEFEVRCLCGNIYFKEARSIISGKSKRCKSCAGINYAIKSEKKTRAKSVGLISTALHSHYRLNAKKRNIYFEVSKEQIWELFQKQDGKCKLSGVEITLSLEVSQGNPDWKKITASLDRIDSNYGYVIDNIQWVHKHVNRMKRDYQQEYFINFCKLIALNNAEEE